MPVPPGSRETQRSEGSTQLSALRDVDARLCLLVITRGVVTTALLPDTGEVAIGRSAGCEVTIDDASISRRHALLRVAKRAAAARRGREPAFSITIEDLGSANGTFLRGPRAAPHPSSSGPAPVDEGEEAAVRLEPGKRAALGVGDFVDLGATVLVVWRAGQEGPDVAPRSARPAGVRVPLPAAGAAKRPADGRVLRTGIVVKDPAMRRLYEILSRVAVGDIGVILLGETGVGKEVLAEALHGMSPRVGKPFLALNCAALSETLLESELFGHERGSFTGAIQAKPGLFETADGGTVFLDEVGELPLGLQSKLLRVIEEREAIRIGGLRPRAVDVRFVAATNRDLEAHVARGLFRQDLYFRLNGISLLVPPLRDRQSEIEDLARGFAEQAARAAGLPRAPEISPGALDVMLRHAWPGNVRELRNVIERAMLLSRGEAILPEHLASVVGRTSDPSAVKAPGIDRTSNVSEHPTIVPPPAAPGPGGLRGDIEAFERQRIADALERCGGNQTRAAKMLGISRRTLTNRLGQYELPRPRKKG